MTLLKLPRAKARGNKFITMQLPRALSRGKVVDERLALAK